MNKKFDEKILREIIISVIIITGNDENSIENTLKSVKQILSENYPNYEILIIDNNSKDRTIERIRRLYKQIPHIKIIQLSKTFSTDIAYTAGLDNAIGDYAILIDIHMVSPQNIPTFINKLFEGYDIVTGRPKKEALSLVERFSKNYLNYEQIHLLAINRKVINILTKIKRKSRNFIYIIGSSIGFSKTTLEYSSTTNKNKFKNPNLLKFFFILLDIIISNSFKPIRVLTAIGMFLSLMFLFYIGIMLVFALFLRTYFIPLNILSFASVIGAMFFILFSLLTLMSEYIIRILDESRNEPLYYISEEMDKSVVTKGKKFNIV